MRDALVREYNLACRAYRMSTRYAAIERNRLRMQDAREALAAWLLQDAREARILDGIRV